MKIKLVHKFEDIVNVNNLLEAWLEFLDEKKNKDERFEPKELKEDNTAIIIHDKEENDSLLNKRNIDQVNYDINKNESHEKLEDGINYNDYSQDKIKTDFFFPIQTVNKNNKTFYVLENFAFLEHYYYEHEDIKDKHFHNNSSTFYEYKSSDSEDEISDEATYNDE